MLAHIVRLDHANTRGWQVRLGLSDDSGSKYESKLFSDRSLGGKNKARRQAEEYLKKKLRERGIENLPKGRRRGMMFAENPERVLKSNRSGRTGVYRGEHPRKLVNGTQQVRYWAASYAVGPDGKKTKRSRRFYFGTERTEEEAKELAIRFREEWEEAFLRGGARAVREYFRLRGLKGKRVRR